MKKPKTPMRGFNWRIDEQEAPISVSNVKATFIIVLLVLKRIRVAFKFE